MNKLFSLFCVVAFVFFMQHDLLAKKNEYPVVNGKIVYTDTLITNVDKSVASSRIELWKQAYSSSVEERKFIENLNDSDQGVVEYTFIDYMLMKKSTWSIYAMYMKYTVRFIYDDNVCNIRVSRISYIEPDELAKGSAESVVSIPAETILLKDKYKVAFVKNASELIKSHTNEIVSDLFFSIKKEFGLSDK